MNKKKTSFNIDVIKYVLSLKRTRITLYMVAVLWLAVVTQMIVNHNFRDEFMITEAFVKTNAEDIESSIEVVSEYKGELLSEAGKNELIQRLADAIGLKIDDEITVWKDDTRTEYFFIKHAKQATTEIKIVSALQEEDYVTRMKNYIIVRISILQGIKSVDNYKRIIEDALADLGVENKQVTLQFEGNQEGDLTSKEKHEIAELLIKELQGEIAQEYDEGDIYTVYAYTGLLDEYIVSAGCKLNVQVAITYNELTNKTKITLATPILSKSW